MLTDAHRSVVLSPMDVVGRLEFDTLLEVNQGGREIFVLERGSSRIFRFGGHSRVPEGSTTPSGGLILPLLRVLFTLHLSTGTLVHQRPQLHDRSLRMYFCDLWLGLETLALQENQVCATCPTSLWSQRSRQNLGLIHYLTPVFH